MRKVEAGSPQLRVNEVQSHIRMPLVIVSNGNDNTARAGQQEKELRGPGRIQDASRGASIEGAIAVDEFDPPASFAEGFATRGYSTAVVDLLVAQFRRDKAHSRLQLARERAVNPKLDPEERRAARAERSRLQSTYQELESEYANLWPGDQPPPFFDRKPNRRAVQQKKDKRFARRLRILIANTADAEQKGRILAENPDVAEAYRHYQAEEHVRQDVQKAEELGKGNIIYCDSQAPDLGQHWQRFFDEPLHQIVDGLTMLLGKGNTMLIEEAEHFLDKEVQRLALNEDDKLRRDIYVRLHNQWPHISILHARGGIETAAGALAYYDTLGKRLEFETP